MMIVLIDPGRPDQPDEGPFGLVIMTKDQISIY
jgi:hypothetical protein